MTLRRRCWLFAVSLALALSGTLMAWPVSAQSPVVRAVLFYSPTCPHCHQVISQDLPPLFEQYGDQLHVLGVDTSTEGGQALYQAAIERFDIPAERQGVPTLVIGGTVLVGSFEIPDQLPGLIEHHLAGGGVDWPDIPGLAEAMEAAAPTPGPDPTPGTVDASPDTVPPSPVPTGLPDVAESLPDDDTGSMMDRTTSEGVLGKLRRDPLGNGLSIAVLLGMVTALGAVLSGAVRVWRADHEPPDERLAGWRGWTVMALCLVGLGVSLYMTYVETTHASAVCGPIGDCNTVQQSAYALLFGLVPVGLLGLVGYAVMLVAWAGGRWGRGWPGSLAALALAGVSLLGTLFSIYLTFLEPFVIGATCAWCLTSAVAVTLIMLLSFKPGLARLRTVT